jgi:hypothetical protein
VFTIALGYLPGLSTFTGMKFGHSPLL